MSKAADQLNRLGHGTNLLKGDRVQRPSLTSQLPRLLVRGGSLLLLSIKLVIALGAGFSRVPLIHALHFGHCFSARLFLAIFCFPSLDRLTSEQS